MTDQWYLWPFFAVCLFGFVSHVAIFVSRVALCLSGYEYEFDITHHKGVGGAFSAFFYFIAFGAGHAFFGLFFCAGIINFLMLWNETQCARRS